MITSLDRAMRFAFREGERLYRDHLGRRVVADVEGAGFAWIEQADSPLLLVREDGPGGAFPVRFEDGLLVLAEGEGAVSIAVRQGTGAPERTAVIECETFEGCGWLIHAERAVVDARPAPLPTEELPIPVFMGARGEGLRVVPECEIHCVVADRFTMDDAAALHARGWRVQNVSKPVRLLSSDERNEPSEGVAVSHLNAASWTSPIPKANRGVILRKRYDRFHGRQRARVFIDGELAGWWYAPEEDRRARWAWSSFGIAPELTAGKSSIEITIDPPASAPLWSVAEIEVWALTA